MRIARDFGGIETLLPDGIEDIRDCPHHLFDAIQMALQFLGWYENLDEDEIPPRAIWFSDRHLREHFRRVRKAREEKYGGKDGKDNAGPIEDPIQNAASKDLIVGH